jgi:hypothetical protein
MLQNIKDFILSEVMLKTFWQLLVILNSVVASLHIPLAPFKGGITPILPLSFSPPLPIQKKGPLRSLSVVNIKLNSYFLL